MSHSGDGLVAPRATLEHHSASRRRWATALSFSALACTLVLVISAWQHVFRFSQLHEESALMEALDQSPGSRSQDESAKQLAQAYLTALHTGSHEVYISSVTDAEQMAGSGEKLAVPCSFGVKCHLHIQPTLRERTRGLWLKENGGDLAVQPLPVLGSKGPWQSQHNELLASAEGSPGAQQYLSEQRKRKTMSSLSESEATIKNEIAQTLQKYTNADGKV